MNVLGHVLGLDNGSGRWYLWWSGIGSDLTYLAAVGVALRHLNCHTGRCWRLAIHHHPLTGVRSCRKHLA